MCILEKDCALKKAMNNPPDCQCSVGVMFDGIRWQGRMTSMALGTAKLMIDSIMHPERDFVKHKEVA